MGCLGIYSDGGLAGASWRLETTIKTDKGNCMCLGETRNNQEDGFVYGGKISKSKRKLLEG
jgi:hypothetical protein